jgi:hypothetical protein
VRRPPKREVGATHAAGAVFDNHRDRPDHRDGGAPNGGCQAHYRATPLPEIRHRSRRLTPNPTGASAARASIGRCKRPRGTTKATMDFTVVPATGDLISNPMIDRDNSNPA